MLLFHVSLELSLALNLRLAFWAGPDVQHLVGHPEVPLQGAFLDQHHAAVLTGELVPVVVGVLVVSEDQCLRLVAPFAGAAGKLPPLGPSVHRGTAMLSNLMLD